MSKAFLVFPIDVSLDELQINYNYDLTEKNNFYSCEFNVFIKIIENCNFKFLSEFEKQVYKKIINGNNDSNKLKVAQKLLDTIDFESIEVNGSELYIHDIIYDNDLFNFYTYDNSIGLFDYIYTDTFKSFKTPEDYFLWIEEQIKITGNYSTWGNYVANELMICTRSLPKYFSTNYFEEYKKEFKKIWGDKPLNLVLYHT